MTELLPTIIRPLTAEDIPQAMLIERACYEFPWSEKIFQDCHRVGYQCSVIVSGESILGYAWLMIGPGEGHILNICTHPAYRNQGLARRLLRHCLSQCLERDIYEAFLEVRPSNASACHLYESEGFHVVGERKNYYPAQNNQREDAWVMAKTLFKD